MDSLPLLVSDHIWLLVHKSHVHDLNREYRETYMTINDTYLIHLKSGTRINSRSLMSGRLEMFVYNFIRGHYVRYFFLPTKYYHSSGLDDPYAWKQAHLSAFSWNRY